MKKQKLNKTKLLILIIPAIMVIVGIILFCVVISKESAGSYLNENFNTSTPQISSQKTIEVPVYVDQNLFYSSIDNTKKYEEKKFVDVRGGILPHHDLVSDLIADFFQKLSESAEPKTFIILGPNHLDVGLSPAISGRVVWQTPMGPVSNDYDILEELEMSGAITFDEENFIQEHSIKVLTPFIKYYFPDAKIVPIIFTSKHTLEQSLSLADDLKKYLDNKEVVLISSVDFSHYLSSALSEEKDKITLEAIESNNYEMISSLNSDYLDSPASLIVLLRTMELLAAENIEVLQHTDAGGFLGQELKNSTSYFTIFFTDKLSSLKATLVFGGDVMLSRDVWRKMKEHGDFSWPFLEVSNELSKADLAVVNLESPFSTNGLYNVSTDSNNFNADPRSIEGLKLAGIDLVTLANNHFGNQRQQGMIETFEILETNNIDFIGAGRNFSAAHRGEIFKINGIRFGFLAYAYPETQYVATNNTPGIANMEIEQVKKDIIELKRQADVLVIIMHAGNEYTKLPNGLQKSFAHSVIDAGADFVIGHHPHWVQLVEFYKEKPIFYSLGNLIFDQEWSRETKQGVITKAHFVDKKLDKIEIIPIHIQDFGQPKIIEDESEIKQILERMNLQEREIDL